MSTERVNLTMKGHKMEMSMTEHAPMPVAGYTSQSDAKIALANEILARAAENAMPRVAATIVAMTEKGNAVGLERAADTLDALADDIISGRRPATDIKDAATYLRSIAKKKRAEAEKVLNRN